MVLVSEGRVTKEVLGGEAGNCGSERAGGGVCTGVFAVQVEDDTGDMRRVYRGSTEDPCAISASRDPADNDVTCGSKEIDDRTLLLALSL